MKVVYRENKQFREARGYGQCPSLTDGKEYDVEDIISDTYEDSGKPYVAYVLQEDDHDQQEPYPPYLFDIVEDDENQTLAKAKEKFVA